MKCTTAGELIASLSELDPDTHVFVDIGMHDWDHSSAIELTPVAGGNWPASKSGAVHLTGLDEFDAREEIKGEVIE